MYQISNISKEILYENLFHGDLEGVIDNKVSFDEFEPKCSEDAIVIGFYSKEEQACIDLSLFLDRSICTSIIDVDVSPAMNEKGEYMVFVEFDSKVDIDELFHMFDLVEHLSLKTKWLLKPYKYDKLVPLTKRNLYKLLKRAIKMKKK